MKKPILTATFILCASPFAAFATELPQKYVITTELAEMIAKEAIAECKSSDTYISASVVNDQGRLVYFYRGEGTGTNSIHTSFRKAYTSATLKTPTSALNLAPEAEGFSQLGKMEDDILLLAGGLPLFYKGALVGAIGLSGAPNPDLEEECGEIAIGKVMPDSAN